MNEIDPKELAEMKTELVESNAKDRNKNIIRFPGIELDLSDQGQLKQFKESYTKNATPQELGMFVAIMKTTGLNPFKKELWFVKY